ncbi:uncharacterized protein LOC143733929 isoform X1 [Siphateles boraxobius]|uniref:uncharacterized protein LOC143733929 isoform X1 n=1 Tax=Siphateles boraxobius TaxID=180520 RepID=UPI004064746B
MADEADQRSVLVEIPEPQAKVTERLRRSYMEILCSRLTVTHTCSRRLRSEERIHACQESKQLMDTLLLAEQSVQMASGSLTSDLSLLLHDLHQKKTSVYRSIPYSRLGSNRDAHCYRKARPHLMAFWRACEEGGRVFERSGEWQKLLEFVQSASRLSGELPLWETSEHNSLRERCYNTLAAFCTTALQKHTPSASRARGLLRRFRAAPASRRVIASCLEELEKILQEHQRINNTHTPTRTSERWSCDPNI